MDYYNKIKLIKSEYMAKVKELEQEKKHLEEKSRKLICEIKAVEEKIFQERVLKVKKENIEYDIECANKGVSDTRDPTPEREGIREFRNTDFTEDDFKTEYGKSLFREKGEDVRSGPWLSGIQIMERWMREGNLPAMTYMIIPSLISGIEKGTFRKEYEGILKELHPRSYMNYLKTGKIITSFKPTKKGLGGSTCPKWIKEQIRNLEIQRAERNRKGLDQNKIEIH